MELEKERRLTVILNGKDCDRFEDIVRKIVKEDKRVGLGKTDIFSEEELRLINDIDGKL